MPPRCGATPTERPCLLAVEEQCDSEDDEQTALLQASDRSAAPGLHYFGRVRSPAGATRALLLCGAFVGSVIILPPPFRPGRGSVDAGGLDGSGAPTARGLDGVVADPAEAIVTVGAVAGAVPALLGRLPLEYKTASCDFHPKCKDQNLHGVCCPNNVLGKMEPCCEPALLKGAANQSSQGPDQTSSKVTTNVSGGPLPPPPSTTSNTSAKARASTRSAGFKHGTARFENVTALFEEDVRALRVASSTSAPDLLVATPNTPNVLPGATNASDVEENATSTTTQTVDLGIICGEIYCEADAVCCATENGAALCGAPGSYCCGDTTPILCMNTSQCCNGVCLSASTPCLTAEGSGSR